MRREVVVGGEVSGGDEVVAGDAGGEPGQRKCQVEAGVLVTGAEAVDGAAVGADVVGELASAVAVEDGQDEVMHGVGGGVVVARHGLALMAYEAGSDILEAVGFFPDQVGAPAG